MTERTAGRAGRWAVIALAVAATAPAALAQHSVARQWNDLLLESIRKDFARPTVHARNLFHVSAAMWDAWATYDLTAQPVIFGEDHGTASPTVDALREEAISYAAYTILKARFATSPAAPTVMPMYDTLMTTLGYSTSNPTVVGNTPDAIGNRIAAAVLAFGAADKSNEAGGYANLHYVPSNQPLIPTLPGNPSITFPNQWQPLALQYFVDQSGNPFPFGYPQFLSPEWGQVTPFSLSQRDLTVNRRGNFDYWIYHDPGAPPLLGSASAADYKWGFELVSAWSSHLDPADGVMIDISPGAIGNATLPTGPAQYGAFYDFAQGGDWGTGHPVNPVTGQPYAPQLVPRGDYGRVLAEFWADGPDSETPPGHWFSIMNYVSDHPQTVKQIGGTGPVVSDLEWDVKVYLALGGAMHDCAISAWGVKGWYNYLRPISAIRYMADIYAQNPSHPNAITLVPGFVEEVTLATTAPGQRHEHLAGEEGKVAVYAWRGPDYINDPATDVAGVGWILAENWWPYQRPTFVTPPFAGYVSGHSTFSRAAAVVLHRFTGSPYFPGGLGEFFCPQDDFLVFEKGPSVDLTLQWASYYDASDQTSLSRIWGGIHPPADDIPGRVMGQAIGNEAFDLAVDFWNGVAVAKATYSSSGTNCVGTNGLTAKLVGVPHARPVIDTLMSVDVVDMPLSAPGLFMLSGIAPLPALDLTFLGAPGCTLDVDWILADLVVATAGTARWSFPIANDPTWLGQTIYSQAATYDFAANALHYTLSNVGAAFIGR